jgi:hypothetical protein
MRNADEQVSLKSSWVNSSLNVENEAAGAYEMQVTVKVLID